MSGDTVVDSPLCWIGGKKAAAKRIVAAFPSPSAYGTFVEVFGGAAHVLVRKPPARHLEVFNDLNDDLVNFWMTARDHAEDLQRRIDTLPFSRTVYQDYLQSLVNGEAMDTLERAARWFYLLRSTFGGVPNFRQGWGHGVTNDNMKARTIRTATELLSLVAERFRYVQIEHQDFEKIITAYQGGGRPKRRTLFYVDPPYIDCEDYYNMVDGTALFTRDDHTRLAILLNATPAFVALSYYEHPMLDDLYPAPKWRRMTWTQTKAVERTRETRQLGREVLLMNYPASLGGLWHEQENQLDLKENL